MTAFVVAILTKATIVTIIALGCTRLARATRAAVRHLALAAAFAVLMLLPVASLFGPSLRLEIPIAVSTGLVDPLPDAAPYVTAIGASHAGDTGATVPAARSPLPVVAALVTAAWLVGAGVFLLPVIAGAWQMLRVRRSALPWRDAQALVDRLARESGIRRQVEVAVSEAMTGPVTCGIARPAIILPPEAQMWTDDDRERAFVHELEHVRRGDWLTQSLTRIVCAIYWMHPLVWIAWRQLALEAERACDDAVLRRQTIARGAAADPTMYADQLVGLARRLTTTKTSPLVAMAARHDLSARVAALVDARQRRGPVGTRWVVLAGGIAALLIATISPLRIVAVATEQQPANAASAARFDAATIKPCEATEAPPGPARGTMGGTNASFSPGRMNVPCVTLEQLIYLAYAGAGMPMEGQLVGVVPGGASDDKKVRGGPAWVHSQHTKFAVEAAAAGASDRYVLVGTMLQSLLEDRFKLKVHRGTEDVPMFAMTVAKAGLRIKPMQPGDCVPYDAATYSPNATKPTCGSLTMGGNGPNVVWKFSEFELRSLAYRLSSALGAFVIDRTGVTDKFMLRLEFHPDESTPGIHWIDRGGDAPEAASIFTALEQQVGVRLEKTRGPQGYLVIDHVEPLGAAPRFDMSTTK
jgi:bla regulator protein BlaR1